MFAWSRPAIEQHEQEEEEKESPSIRVVVVSSGERAPDQAECTTFIDAQSWVRERLKGTIDDDYVFRLITPTVAFWHRAGDRSSGVLMGYDTATSKFTSLDDSLPIELPQPYKRSRSPSLDKSSNSMPADSSKTSKKKRRTPRKKVALDL
jgi:hypothetical protein